ncbi:MAG: glycoside hydrolase family 127 protein [Lewinellaceae bacterium]|nr:glycoside hydrolase family 127 protein [Saprospiraceae bacterium]MCB9341530.1 glycoside hydrolase family 127 protein [Lewinellaceae bacterium]
MKKVILLVLATLLLYCRPKTQTPSYNVKPVPFTQVKITDNFWAPRIETVRTVTIPYAFQQCVETGRVKNFEVAGGSARGAFCGQYAFDDSDVYKVIEGAAYSLQVHPDTALENYVDGLIEKIAKAQEPDGYLYTWRSIYDREKAAGVVKEPVSGQFYKGSDTRWEHEDQHSHELYNAGHLYEAAVAYFQATGKRTLLDVALKNADLVEKTFGWGKLEKATGHQEIEIGLVKLFQVTGEQRYLDLAQFFLDVRGYGDIYMQNHQKVKDQREIAGHAVRACYMYSAMADVTALKGTAEYLPALDAIWEDVVGKKMYVTGGIGSSGSNEGFSQPYDLPNYSAYCETCASIAFVLWNQRMFQLTGDAKYMDVLERTLYNALDAGLSFSGDRFFYPNPLESRKNVERSPWFACACCPSNVARFFPSIPGYIYAKRGNEIYVNLFVSSETTVQNVNSRLQLVNVNISQQTKYPWDGKVTIRVEPEKPNTFTLKVRIPGWAQGDAVPFDLYSFPKHDDSKVYIFLNGKSLPVTIRHGYAIMERKWKKGDQVEIALPMPVRQVAANSKVAADADRLALQRGPLMYCLEGKDQPDDRILNIMVNDLDDISTKFEPDMLGGLPTLSFDGFLVKKKSAPDQGDLQKMRLKAIPYFAWANRGMDNMLVWLPNGLRAARPISQPSIASQSKISASDGVKGELSGVADQWLPQNADDHENPYIHWWPHFGTTEWLQYDFEKEEQVGTVRVYWFDDEASGGGCRIPESWRVLYLENGEWKQVYAPKGYAVTKDGWDKVQFEPVKTSALRLELVCRQGVSAGVHEWEVR